MQRTTLRALVVAALVAATVLLSGCSILEPTRDADGRVAGPLELSASQLRVGDCFTFIDQNDLSRVTATPCALAHTHIVIGQGELSTTKVALSENLQVAVSLACARPFDTFIANAPEGADPQQEFLVAMLDKPGGQVAAYSCVATDSIPVTAGG
jgi:hypothetical protein